MSPCRTKGIQSTLVSLMNSFNRALVQPTSLANATCDLRAGTRNSSSSILPGCIGFVGCSARIFAIPASCTGSVVIHDPHVPCPPVLPTEHDSPLVVDPDAVISPPASLERLEPIAAAKSGQPNATGPRY